MKKMGVGNVEWEKKPEVKEKLTEKCKTKFNTLRKKFRKKKREDSCDFKDELPGMIRNDFDKAEYPQLYSEL